MRNLRQEVMSSVSSTFKEETLHYEPVRAAMEHTLEMTIQKFEEMFQLRVTELGDEIAESMTNYRNVRALDDSAAALDEVMNETLHLMARRSENQKLMAKLN